MTATTQQRDFQQEATQVLSAVRNTFAEVLASLPDRVARAQQVEHALSLKKKLAWQIWRLSQAKDAGEILQHLPGVEGVRIFLDAARTQAPADAVARARQAVADLHELIEVHAGDRATLEMMVKGLSAVPAGQTDPADEEFRRSAFVGSSYIYGAQARSQLSINLWAPGDDPDRVDIALVSGLIDFRQLRPDVAWTLASIGRDSATDEHVDRQPIEPSGDAPTDVPLLSSWCSRPLPSFRKFEVAPEIGVVQIESGRIGETGSVTLLTGEILRNAGYRYAEDKDDYVNLYAHIKAPCEILVHDLFIHEDLGTDRDTFVRVYSELQGMIGPHVPRGEHNRLPIEGRMELIGKGPGAAATPDVPRYAELARSVFNRLEWDGDRFSLYRLRMRYPVFPSAVAVGVHLPPR